ncbi:MAG: diguanylate cyclase, partial [Candidatus Aegiribacteria sp.]|nr:diguanylate cyclase [Candidatus Aegiribacteria sp.]MBD3294215.1 diguanylate cyclase [Candidatus Fermentibacteria bacterium]
LETGSLRDIRDRIQEKLEEDPLSIIEEVNGRSDRISSRSEISRSLETLGRLLKADRILAVNVSGESVRMVEGCGTGKWRMPGEESLQFLRALPEEPEICDSFGKTPFGSRRYGVFPLEQSLLPLQRRMTDYVSSSGGRNYILAESDTPFNRCSRMPGFIIESLCGQIGSALLLRSREAMAYNDTQTGTVTGSIWMKQLADILNNGDEGSFSLLLIDIDEMKEVNRIFGYRAGDVILGRVASAIVETLRPFDMVGRLDSGLFGVILLEKERENVRTIAARVCSAVAGGDLRADRVPLTVTVGGTLSSGPASDPFEIIRRGWAALRQGKLGGGGRAVIWSRETPEPSKGFPPALFSTGDPGWDYSVFEVVLKVLLRGELEGEEIAELYRDALRCQFVYLEVTSGETFTTGSRILRSIPGELPVPETGDCGVKTHGNVLGRYFVMSCMHENGGKLVAAWEEESSVTKGLRNVFAALARLSRFALGSA